MDRRMVKHVLKYIRHHIRDVTAPSRAWMAPEDVRDIVRAAVFLISVLILISEGLEGIRARLRTMPCIHIELQVIKSNKLYLAALTKTSASSGFGDRECI